MILEKEPKPHSVVLVWPDDVPLPEGTAGGERRFEIETRGPWHVLSKLRGLAAEKLPDGRYKVFGDRTLSSPKQEGYAVHGQVSVEGKKRGAFTSSMLVAHRGKLVDLAILYVCGETK